MLTERDYDTVTQELKKMFQRELTADDLEMVQYFIDGL
jgi:hypothetical protein